MKRQTRAIVIGGGIAGASVLYQLAKAGWSDAMLVEQGDLADGTTWHSAGHCIVPYVSRHLTHFTRESISTFRDLELETGRSPGFLEIGALTLATTPGRVDELRRLAGAARSEDVPYELIGPAEAARIWPLAELDGVLLAGYSPSAGRVDPSTVTAILAAAAAARGAEVHRQTSVTGVRQLPSGSWEVATSQGPVEAEVVVNAAGQWARDVGRLSGLEIPTLPLEHQYVLTAPIAELAGVRDLPILRDPDCGFYLRQEGEGVLIGVYEDDVRAWGADGIPDDFLRQLLPGDLDRIAGLVEGAGRRVPVVADAGIRTVLNGPDAYTSDDQFIMGPVAGRPTYFLFAGFNSAGVQTAPGAARYLVEWIVGGEPTTDLDEFDARRFGPQVVGRRYLDVRAKETYRSHYPIRYPTEEHHSGRPSRTSPLHDLLRARGGVFGERFGWERPLFFGDPDGSTVDDGSFRRPAWFERTRAEAAAIHERVGIIDQTSFSKHLVEGPGAAAFLDGMIATALPEVGRVGYAILLTNRGTIDNDLTISRLDDDRFYLVGAASGEVRDRERLLEHAPTNGSVAITSVSTRFGALTITGPGARTLLERASGQSFADDVAPFMSVRPIELGFTSGWALRVSYSGELGWEVHLPIEMLRSAYLELQACGRDLGLTDAGYRVLDALGMERGYGAIGADLSRDYSPIEAGLGTLIRMDKGPFVGRDGLLDRHRDGVPRHRAWLLFDADVPVLPSGMEPVSQGGRLVASTVRGGHGHRLGRAIAVAYLPTDVVEDPSGLTVGILDEEWPVVAERRAPYRAGASRPTTAAGASA